VLLRRGDETWGFPGGHHEEFDRTLWDTAVRELREETGYRGHVGRGVAVELNFYPDLILPGPAHGKETPELRYVCFVGWVATEFRPVLDGEHHGSSWLTLSQMRLLREMHPGVHAVIKEIG